MKITATDCFFKIFFDQFRNELQNYCSDLSLCKKSCSSNLKCFENSLSSAWDLPKKFFSIHRTIFSCSRSEQFSKQNTKFEILERKARNSLGSSDIAVYIAGMYISCSKW